MMMRGDLGLLLLEEVAILLLLVFMDDGDGQYQRKLATMGSHNTTRKRGPSSDRDGSGRLAPLGLLIILVVANI